MKYELELSTFVPQPPEQVYDFVLDMHNDVRWAPMVRAVSQIAGEGPGAGAVYRIEQWVGPGRYRPVEIRVADAARPSLIRWSCEDRHMSYTSEMRLQPVSGGTRITQHNRNVFSGSGMPAWVVSLLARITLRRQFRKLRRALATPAV